MKGATSRRRKSSRGSAAARGALVGLALLAELTTTSPAEAAVQRFALLVGSNRGQGSDATLRYAESDAARLAQVLRDLGGFAPADTVLRGLRTRPQPVPLPLAIPGSHLPRNLTQVCHCNGYECTTACPESDRPLAPAPAVFPIHFSLYTIDDPRPP